MRGRVIGVGGVVGAGGALATVVGSGGVVSAAALAVAVALGAALAVAVGAAALVVVAEVSGVTVGAGEGLSHPAAPAAARAVTEMPRAGLTIERRTFDVADELRMSPSYYGDFALRGS
jgi:hypothetical protein